MREQANEGENMRGMGFREGEWQRGSQSEEQKVRGEERAYVFMGKRGKGERGAANMTKQQSRVEANKT